MNEHLKVLIFSSILGACIGIIAWNMGFFRLSKRGVEDRPKIRFFDVLGAFAIFIIFQLILVPAVFLIFLYITGNNLGLVHSSPSAQGWANVFGALISTAAVVLYSSYFKPYLKINIWRDEAFASFSKKVSDCFFGAATWIICFPIVLALGELVTVMMIYLFDMKQIDQVAVKYLKVSSADPVLFWSMASVIVLVVPVLEEMLFRGFLQTWIKERFGVIPAILSASFIFSLFHFSPSQGLYNSVILSILFFLGGFLGFIYERQNSLFAPIGLHVFFNLSSVSYIFLTAN